MAIRDYAIEVRVINPLEKERQARSALHGPEMVFVGICYQNESHNPVERKFIPSQAKILTTAQHRYIPLLHQLADYTMEFQIVSGD